MIYPANFEQKIGFDRLREQVAALCTMRAARGKLAEETFSASGARDPGGGWNLPTRCACCSTWSTIFPAGEYPDVDHVVAKLRVEGTFLDVGEVVTLHRALSLVGSVVAFILAREGAISGAVCPQPRRRGIPGIVQRIDAIVDRFGNIRDNASPAPAGESGAPSANAKGRPLSGCRRCLPPPKGPVSSMPTPRSRSAKGRP